ncbi:Insulin gene enhancer protein ISL-1 [Triplophysa tibetana]|uniref:Insulin gene enhancer protein ISL-1 n=1 Tax=Triplophysa tibetana TaxID=1572043 RepID=A0A5A9N4B8_9TELE|nr:Insulin gene enhancer protein ISL-1 [Triplophysa tibetana]
MEDVQKRNKVTSFCVGCGHQILDRFILRVSPDLEWHAECLRCAECHQYLDDSCTCFIRDGKTFCKEHSRVLNRNEYVIRTRVDIYHTECFRCESCDRQLLPGDEYVLWEGRPLCMDHHKFFKRLSTSNDLHEKTQDTDVHENSKPISQSSCPWASAQRRSERATRVRTVLSESQLRMLQTCYSANSRPDALMKEQLVEMTGLSPRVIRVWFQNKRCKDKKMMMRHTQKQREGHPDVSEEPILADIQESQDIDMLGNPSWKLLTNFIQKHTDLSPFRHVLSLSKEGARSGAGEVVSISAQLSDTPSRLTASPKGINE